MVNALVRRIRPALRRVALAAVLGGTALPVMAETLGDTMVAAYRHSALLDQQRAVLRAADEDVATAMAALRPVLDWTLQHTFIEREGMETTSTVAELTASMTLYDFGRSQAAIDFGQGNRSGHALRADRGRAEYPADLCPGFHVRSCGDRAG